MRASKDNRGLTLIEVMMAMLISFIVFLGLTETILIAVNANVQNALRDEGVRVAEAEVSNTRNIPFDNVFTGSALFPATGTVSRAFRRLSMNYSVARTVTDVDANMKQVVITVSWTRGSKTDNTAFTTILRKR